jgi:uncharacterized membrane protein YdfJ with MMPL/SSD domain
VQAAVTNLLCVGAAFGVLNGDPTIKQFGAGLSVAVLLASAMVLSLAPAMLTLFGRAVWWLPRWLSNLLPHVDIEGEAEPPAPEPAPAPRPVTDRVPDD